jgi:esterase
MDLSPPTPPVPLYARDLGGQGPAMVILHGLLGSSRNWQTAGRDLAAGRRVWALDLRNHGQSPHAEPMDYPALAADVLAWMDREGIGQADLVGHSMGGKTAMLLACRHPQRVRRLVVVDIAPKAYRWAAHRAEFTAMMELNLADLKSRAEAEMRMEGRVSDWAMRKFLATNLERSGDGSWRWVVNLPVLARALPLLEASPLENQDGYGGPVLWVCGGKSAYVAEGDHAAMAAHFPAVRRITLPESGHNPHIDAREAFVAALKD